MTSEGKVGLLVLVLAAVGAGLLATAQDLAPGEQRLERVHTAMAFVAAALVAFFGIPTPRASTAPDVHEKALCPRCLQRNRPWDWRCRRCQVPLLPIATLLPYERALARGWMLGDAVVRPDLPARFLWPGCLAGAGYLALSARWVGHYLEEPFPKDPMGAAAWVAWRALIAFDLLLVVWCLVRRLVVRRESRALPPEDPTPA
jgi:hypothetical protein